MLPLSLWLGPSRHAALSTGMAWLIISLGVVQACVCAYILLSVLEAPGVLIQDEALTLPGLRLYALDVESLRWLLAGSAANAVAMTFVPRLLHRARRYATQDDGSLVDWPGTDPMRDVRTWIPPDSLGMERPGVVALRIDNLDSIVNVHGRAVAQRAVRATAEALGQSARRSDIVTRTAHDRFAIVLSCTDPSTLSETAARLRGAVSALAIPAPGGQTVQVEPRLGWASGDGHDLGALLDLANAALHDMRRTADNPTTGRPP